MKTTVFLFHPNFANSRVNKALAAGLPGDIEVRNMYALYPDFQIDVAKEQAVMEESDPDRLANADVLVLRDAAVKEVGRRRADLRLGLRERR